MADMNGDWQAQVALLVGQRKAAVIELRAIAEKYADTQPNIAIVLFTLTGSMEALKDYELACYVKQFALEMRAGLLAVNN